MAWPLFHKNPPLLAPLSQTDPHHLGPVREGQNSTVWSIHCLNSDFGTVRERAKNSPLFRQKIDPFGSRKKKAVSASTVWSQIFTGSGAKLKQWMVAPNSGMASETVESKSWFSFRLTSIWPEISHTRYHEYEFYRHKYHFDDRIRQVIITNTLLHCHKSINHTTTLTLL